MKSGATSVDVTQLQERENVRAQIKIFNDRLRALKERDKRIDMVTLICAGAFVYGVWTLDWRVLLLAVGCDTFSSHTGSEDISSNETIDHLYIDYKAQHNHLLNCVKQYWLKSDDQLTETDLKNFIDLMETIAPYTKDPDVIRTTFSKPTKLCSQEYRAIVSKPPHRHNISIIEIPSIDAKPQDLKKEPKKVEASVRPSFDLGLSRTVVAPVSREDSLWSSFSSLLPWSSGSEKQTEIIKPQENKLAKVELVKPVSTDVKPFSQVNVLLSKTDLVTAKVAEAAQHLKKQVNTQVENAQSSAVMKALKKRVWQGFEFFRFTRDVIYPSTESEVALRRYGDSPAQAMDQSANMKAKKM